MNTLHAELRVWSSKDGSASMSATFEKVDGDTVTLILPNGRSQVVKTQFLSDADVQWIQKNAPAPARSGDNAFGNSTDASNKMSATLAGKLIDDRGQPYNLASNLPLPKYYLFYYSASWCGPCHMFTPKLIKFYTKMKDQKASFEVILSPDDANQKAEVAYMKEMHMPWPALAFAQAKANGVPRSNWGYIPAMVLVDADGKRLLEVNDDLSQEAFLQKAESLFKQAALTSNP